MNNKFKKGSLALGTIATIAAPVAAVVSCGATANTINWSDDDTYAGVKAKEFLNQIKHLGKTKQNAITVGREQMMELQYQSESIRSIMAQAVDFRYQNWETKMDNGKLVDDMADVLKEQAAYTGNDDDIKKGYTDRIAAINKSTEDNDKKITKVEGFIAKIKTITDKLVTTGEYIADKDDVVANFYKNDYNASDYPKVYKPLSSIHDEKEAIVEDAYKNFYPQYNTRFEADAQWPKELAANYGNAATFGQAVDYLVNQEISAKAFNSYKFEINKSFTVEKKLWAQFIDKDAWKFLIEDGTTGIAGSKHDSKLDDDIMLIKGITKDTDPVDEITLEENILATKRGDSSILTDGTETKVAKSSALSSTEIFLGSTSPDHRMPPKAFEELGQVVKYQHMLIKATQGKTPEEAWTIKADDIKKLFDFVHWNDGRNDKASQGMELVSSPKLFDDADTKFTDFVLAAVSGNSAGTIKVQGSLGVKSEIEYLKEMVPGFSLGALAITEGTGKPITGTPDPIKTIDLAATNGLIAKLKEALKKEMSGYTTDLDKVDAAGIDTANSEIDAVITALGDDKVKTIFGKIFAEFFADKKDLVYKVAGGSDTYLVISQFGIHIIKRSSFIDADAIKGALKKDIEGMAGDSSTTSSTSIAAELNAEFSDTKVMELLVGKDGDAATKDYSDALIEKLKDYNNGKTDDVDKVEIKDIRDVIESVNKLKAKTDVDGALGDKLENWLVTQIDADLRTLTHGTTTTKLGDIYKWVQKAGGVL